MQIKISTKTNGKINQSQNLAEEMHLHLLSRH